LPRPRDFKSTWDKSYEFNETVRDNAGNWGARYLPTDTQFMRYGQPKEELYFQGRDNLHPSGPGAITLSKFFEKETSIIRKELKLSTHKKAPYTETKKYYKPTAGYGYTGARKKTKPIIIPTQTQPTYAPKKEKYFETQVRIKMGRHRRASKKIEENQARNETLSDTADANQEEKEDGEIEDEPEEEIKTTPPPKPNQWENFKVTIKGIGKSKQSSSSEEEDETAMKFKKYLHAKNTEESESEDKKTPESHPPKEKSTKKRKPKPDNTQNKEENVMRGLIKDLVRCQEEERHYFQEKLAEMEERRWHEYEKRQEEKRWYDSERRNTYLRERCLEQEHREGRWNRSPMDYDRGYERYERYDRDRHDYEEFLRRKYSSGSRNRSRSRENKHRRHSRDTRSRSRSRSHSRRPKKHSHSKRSTSRR